MTHPVRVGSPRGLSASTSYSVSQKLCNIVRRGESVIERIREMSGGTARRTFQKENAGFFYFSHNRSCQI